MPGTIHWYEIVRAEAYNFNALPIYTNCLLYKIYCKKNPGTSDGQGTASRKPWGYQYYPSMALDTYGVMNIRGLNVGTEICMDADGRQLEVFCRLMGILRNEDPTTGLDLHLVPAKGNWFGDKLKECAAIRNGGYWVENMLDTGGLDFVKVFKRDGNNYTEIASTREIQHAGHGVLKVFNLPV